MEEQFNKATSVTKGKAAALSYSKKLFNIAKPNYIALFMLLWASFNNWYKESYSKKSKITDRTIIDRLKKAGGEPETNFYKLLSGGSPITPKEIEKFKYNLISFVNIIKSDRLDQKHKSEKEKISYEKVEFSETTAIDNNKATPSTEEELLFSETTAIDNNKATPSTEEELLLEIPAPKNKIYSVTETNKDSFFKETLENIYKIRCCVFHGDFDADDNSFIELLENSYVMLYLLMDKILNEK